VSGFFVPHDLRAPISGAPVGPLAGLACAVKDMYDIAGERTGGGSPDWLAAQKPAASHAPAVRKVLDAGATIIGKTICDEFFYSVSGANAHYGTPANLRAPGRLPGGSSSGSAAAVAAGACDFALGSAWMPLAPWQWRPLSMSPAGSPPAPVSFAASAPCCLTTNASCIRSIGC
jgi:amidase